MIAAFTSHRELLFGIAYRMLGRVAESEDIITEIGGNTREHVMNGCDARFRDSGSCPHTLYERLPL